MPLVEQALGGLDDRGDDAGLRDDAAHRADRAAARPLGDLADLELELRRAGERVAPGVHRRRAGVRGLAAEGDLVALDAEGAEDDAEREVERLEHRALLDVQLEVGGGVLEMLASSCLVEVDAVLGEHVGERVPVGVLARAQLVLVGHRPGGGARAERRAAEARAFLVGPVDEANGRCRLALLGEAPHDLDTGDDVERAVQPAAVRHRVDVPADQHRLLGATRQRPPLVAGLVDLRLERNLLVQPVLRAHPGVGPGDALGAVLVAGQLLQLAKLGDGAARVEWHRVRA